VDLMKLFAIKQVPECLQSCQSFEWVSTDSFIRK